MTTPVLHIDFETRGVLDLKEVGLHRYARDPNTDVWCLSAALDEAEPTLWIQGNHHLWTPFRQHVESGGTVIAHNAPFELEIWNEIMVPRYGWPRLSPEQTYCTMAQSYAMGLPGALEDAALALGLHVLKDTEGRAVMLKYARPWKEQPLRWMDECPEFTVNGNRMTGTDGLARLFAYCQQDVRVERELHKLLMPLSATERKVWLLDYKINQRGVQLDMQTARAAIKLADKIKEEAGAKLSEITGGEVQAVTALPSLKTWLAAHGVEDAEDGLAKQDIVDLLDSDLPDDARAALTIRQEVGKASAAKFDVMAACAGEDGRLRNIYQYHGAGTGRWAGRMVQPHNLVRDMPKPEVVEQVLELVRQGRHDAIDAIYGPPLSMLTRCMRSFFVAAPGKRLLSGDWANVEGRGQAWFANEDWKLKAFVAADNKTGPGIYELAYSRMFGVPVESVKDPSEERQVGKVSELAFGYQGGVGSFHTMGKNYGVKVSDEKADEFKEAWRNAHPRIAGVLEYNERTGRSYRKGGVWRQIQDAAIAAVEHPGEAYTCGHPGRHATYKKVGSFLWCLLPSGRAICYPYPKVLEGEFGPQLTYMTVPSQEDKRKGNIIADPKNASNWARVSGYGGSFFNNIVQGFCRDFLSGCMLQLDAAGAAIVLHTHDDINAETDEPKAARAALIMQKMMRTPPAWAAGFPLYAKVKVLTRYGK